MLNKIIKFIEDKIVEKFNGKIYIEIKMTNGGIRYCKAKIEYDL